MKQIVVIILVIFSVITVSAQQDPQFSQNMFNKLANNPGFAGSRGDISTSILHRSQYMGFGDDGGAAASTQNFSIDAELPFLYGGVGLNIVKDNIAGFSNLGLQASYAYRTELGVGQIGMGMSVGMYQSGLDGGFLKAATAGDPVIPTGDVSGSKLDIGAGVYYNIAGFSNLGLQASYAYRTELGVGQIGMGMSVGMFQSGLDGGFLKAATSGDDAIPTGDVSGSSLDLGAGIYYNTQDVYIGISSAHLTAPTIEWSDGQDYNMERHYFLIAGYYHELNPVLSLNPSIYLKSVTGVSQLDINTNLIYNNKMWGGVSYRLDEGLILLAGMNINEDLRFGLAYDVTMINSLGNSLEVMLGYNFKINYEKPISKYKNPRFL